ncbi:hypothetical protein [Membranihabitans maritimus]|uniref:hypothetical protein n=1 Tax=Membranihabitans maritimus TaxID=2904244 RepID=UPI001F185455|nr:hypothetical protein [Membranihabitans maritimus]
MGKKPRANNHPGHLLVRRHWANNYPEHPRGKSLETIYYSSIHGEEIEGQNQIKQTSTGERDK